MIVREHLMEFDFTGAAEVVRHDDAKPEGEGNTLWDGVDFRVKQADREVWIEVKDYSYHRIKTAAERVRADEKDEADLVSDEFRSWVVSKFLGTTAFLAWTGTFSPTRVLYVLLLDASHRDRGALLGTFSQRLRASFPKRGPWTNRIEYIVTDFNGFNNAFQAYSVKRI